MQLEYWSFRCVLSLAHDSDDTRYLVQTANRAFHCFDVFSTSVII